MTGRPARLRTCALLLAGGLLAGGCATQDEAQLHGIAGKDVVDVETLHLPPFLLGMKVTKEDVSKDLSAAVQTYVEAMTVLSFRRDDLLQATLQVSRLSPNADASSESFRGSVVGNLGSQTPQQVQLGGMTVYLTSGTNQRLSVWFRDKYFFVLATRDDFEQPRTLLRALLEVKP